MYAKELLEGRRVLYLMRWRMQLAAARLADRSAKVSAVARDVGYESEAAFSRAFKRVAGVPRPCGVTGSFLLM
jgi:AraC-like DNA-binding protein